MRRRAGKPGFISDVVRERVEILLALAEKNAKEKPARAKRYIELARKLCTRYNVRVPEIKKRACKKCHAFWVPGRNLSVRVRSRERMMEYRCACGEVARFPFGRKKGIQIEGTESKHILFKFVG
ncbi:MAG: ribonuclease P [Candidatus Micrarchaeota archaeon]